jgi:hypothetical protein
MSPEQLEGKEVDARADVFAFGALLYEMVTGRRAFRGESQASLVSAIMTSEPAPPSTLAPLSPRMLDRVVEKCLEKDPEDRWQSLADVVHVLRGIASDGGADPGASVAPAARRSPSRWGWAAAALFLTTTVLLALGGGRHPLFSALGDPLMRVSEAGGRPQPESSLDEDVSGHYFPTFLPDGRRYLFQHIAADHDRLELDGGALEAIFHLVAGLAERPGRLAKEIEDTWPGIEQTPGGVACTVWTYVPVWVLESYGRQGWTEAKILVNHRVLGAA